MLLNVGMFVSRLRKSAFRDAQMTNNIQCKPEPNPSPTGLQQQAHASAQWTPLTPPTSNTITGF